MQINALQTSIENLEKISKKNDELKNISLSEGLVDLEVTPKHKISVSK